MMRPWVIGTIAANSLRRLARTRSNVFFVFVLPLLLIVVLGSSVAGFEPRIGVVAEGDDALTRDFIDQLAANEKADTEVFDDRDEALSLLQREELTAMVELPVDYEARLLRGDSVEVAFLAIPAGSGFEIQGLVQAVISEQNARIRAGSLATELRGVSPAEGLATATSVADDIPRVELDAIDGEGNAYLETSGFGAVASQELVLFLFLTSMIAAAALIESRRLGVIGRMLSTPASTGEVLAGETAGRYGIAVLQGGFIVGATTLLFGVDWGSWPATLAIIVLFSLVATAAAVLIGALASNESQSTAIGMSLGLAMAALGGSMVPLEIFPERLRQIAHLTPHAWANDAFTTVIQKGGSVADIGQELLVLGCFGVCLLAVATMVLKRSVTN